MAGSTPDPSQVAGLLARGIAAARAGRLEEARRALHRVVKLDERSEQGWLWLSGVVESLDERRICLENVLAINPASELGRKGLRLLEQQERARALGVPHPPTDPSSSSAAAQRARRTLASRHPSQQSPSPVQASPPAAQSWREMVRGMAGPVFVPAVAALVNAGLSPRAIGPAAWGALVLAITGACLWACAIEAPRSPPMRTLFGEVGAESWRKALVGVPGALLWGAGFCLILGKV
jgi:hypothetical protein